ncbi:MAG TPA: hypothetical protein VK154_18715 [Chitinophagales bacterium]|nr:hypothetical protein [Chitinophagales bacterium]
MKKVFLPIALLATVLVSISSCKKSTDEDCFTCTKNRVVCSTCTMSGVTTDYCSDDYTQVQLDALDVACRASGGTWVDGIQQDTVTTHCAEENSTELNLMKSNCQLDGGVWAAQ